jgi:glycosyltransferase involved in cell wall biosynthesis
VADRRLTILLVLSRLERRWVGGIGRVTSAMARALAERGHDVHLAGRAEDPEAVQPLAGVTLHPWPGAGPKLRQVPSLLTTLARLQPDVVHFHAALPHGEVVAAALARRGRGRRPLIACTPHTGSRWDRVGRRAHFGLVRSDLVVAPCEWGRERAIAAGVSPERARSVLNGIELPELPASSSRGPIVLAMGRLVPSKGHDLLVDAFGRISGEEPGWSLVVGGEGPLLPSLQSRVEELDIPVELPGRMDAARKRDLFARASIGVVPSRDDMMPGVMLELQAHGIPVVATPVGGLVEAAQEGKAARLVAAPTVEALAEGLRELMASESLRCQLGSEARRVSAERSWPVLAEQLERHYSLALRRRG